MFLIIYFACHIVDSPEVGPLNQTLARTRADAARARAGPQPAGRAPGLPPRVCGAAAASAHARRTRGDAAGPPGYRYAARVGWGDIDGCDAWGRV